MLNENKNELLKNPRVVDEIKRHLWLESEMAGSDVGFDKAAEDWLERFSTEWMRYHFPEESKKSKTAPSRKRRKKSE